MPALFFRVETKVLWKEWPKEWGLCLSHLRTKGHMVQDGSSPAPCCRSATQLLLSWCSAPLYHLHHHCLLFAAGFLLSSGTWGRWKEMKFGGRDYSLNQQHGDYTHHIYSYCTGESGVRWPHEFTGRAGKRGLWLGTSSERRGRWILVNT